MGSDPVAWVLHDGKAGMASQAVGLAEASGFPFVEKRLAIRLPWACLPPRLWLMPFRAPGSAGARLMPPWPDLVIACGRNAAMPALAIRRASGGRTVAAQIQNPEIGRGEFDLLIVPEHDRLRGPQRDRDARCGPPRDAGAARRRTSPLPGTCGDAAADPVGADRRQQQGLPSDAAAAGRDRRCAGRHLAGAAAARFC